VSRCLSSACVRDVYPTPEDPTGTSRKQVTYAIMRTRVLLRHAHTHAGRRDRLTQTRVKRNVLHTMTITEARRLVTGKLTALVMPPKGRQRPFAGAFRERERIHRTQEPRAVSREPTDYAINDPAIVDLDPAVCFDDLTGRITYRRGINSQVRGEICSQERRERNLITSSVSLCF